jgi:hypothetical protein
MAGMAKLTFSLQVHVEADDGTVTTVLYESPRDSFIEVEGRDRMAERMAAARLAPVFGVMMVGQKEAMPVQPTGDVKALGELEPQRLTETSLIPPPKGRWARDTMQVGIYVFPCPKCGRLTRLDSRRAHLNENEDKSLTVAEMFRCPRCQASCELTLAPEAMPELPVAVAVAAAKAETPA